MANNLAYVEFDGQHQATFGSFSRVQRTYSSPRNSDRTGADLVKSENALARRSSYKYPVWNFSINGVPISATLQLEEGHWFAEIGLLNVIGEGFTPKEAIANLESHIDYFIGFYNEKSEEQLAPMARQLKARFAQVVRI